MHMHYKAMAVVAVVAAVACGMQSLAASCHCQWRQRRQRWRRMWWWCWCANLQMEIGAHRENHFPLLIPKGAMDRIRRSREREGGRKEGKWRCRPKGSGTLHVDSRWTVRVSATLTSIGVSAHLCTLSQDRSRVRSQTTFRSVECCKFYNHNESEWVERSRRKRMVEIENLLPLLSPIESRHLVWVQQVQIETVWL